MGRIRAHLTYSNVMVTLLAFVVLGGTAWALAKNTVGTKQLKANAVHTKDIDDNAVTGTKIGDGAVTADKIASGVIPAAPTATVRSTTKRIAMTCMETDIGFGTFIVNCTGQDTVDAPCNPGEHATGGGYATPSPSGGGPASSAAITDTLPNPSGGTPTGWRLRVTANGSNTSSSSPVPRPPDPEVTAYAVCST